MRGAMERAYVPKRGVPSGGVRIYPPNVPLSNMSEGAGAPMKYGLNFFPTAYTMQPGELGKLAEERGFESLWFPEHTHIPVSRRSPWPGGPELPKEYLHVYDPFVALTAAAATTRDLKLATGVCLIVERDPITTAKTAATLDQVS